MYLKAGKYDLAIKAFGDLAKKRPNSANALWGLYKVYKKKGDAGNAKGLAAQLNEVTRQDDKTLYPL